MDIQYFGANCVRLSDKKVSVIIDDNLSELGLKGVTKADDVSVTTLNTDKSKVARFSVNGPGEYEISEVSIIGIPARAHLDENGKRATMYKIQMQVFNIGVIGHIHPDLTDEQLEELGVVDVLIIPVGGNGYTLDANAAAHLIKKIEPKIVIPTHYADSAIKYEVPQAELALFIKEMGVTEYESVDSLKVKETELGEKTRVVVLNRTK
jgi:L-ascorbate metabolism protein UlaG (beta-lactamase superfamily)